ncbi:MAG: hypothetical protein LBB81_07265 [Treponema sp.]|jgi:hypothetical protein|nr:hypothetical protein [Treponema sp.]
MTLTDRNIIFKAGIVFCSVCTFLVLGISFSIIPVYSTFGENNHRPDDIFQVIASYFTNINYYAVHASISAAVLYSLCSIILIHFYFEQTKAAEILYIAIFTASFSVEALKLVLPLQILYNFHPVYLLITSRILLFGRHFGLFSLFAASICAAGLETEKSRSIILIIAVAAMAVTFSIPIDVQTWDTSLNITIGFTNMFRLIEIVAVLTTVLNFFIAINIQGSSDYVYIGLGALLALFGRNMLLSADNWVTPCLGIVLLITGTWFICDKLHNINLWL